MTAYHLGKLWGDDLKMIDQNIDQRGLSIALMWSCNVFYIAFCTQMHSNIMSPLKEAPLLPGFSLDDRKIIHLQEKSSTSIQ